MFPGDRSNPDSVPFFVPSLFFRLLRSQTFDREKYTHLRADAPNNNNNNGSNGKDKTLVGLRIDDKGGIYLQVNSLVRLY